MVAVVVVVVVVGGMVVLYGVASASWKYVRSRIQRQFYVNVIRTTIRTADLD